MLAALAMLAAAPMGQAASGSAIDLTPDRLTATACQGASCDGDRDSRYRLPLPLEPEPLNRPDRAFDEDGRECNLVGNALCTSSPHMIVGAGEHADRSLTARLEALDE